MAGTLTITLDSMTVP